MRGAAVYARIREELRRAELDQERLVGELESKERQLAGTGKLHDDAFTALATLYLPELGQEAVDAMREQRPGFHARLQAILDEKRRQQDTVDSAIASNREERARQEERLLSVTRELEEKVTERDALRIEVDAELETISGYEEIRARAELALGRLERQKRRLAAAAGERDEKLPAYRKSSLFAYLNARSYGTPEYRGGLLSGRLDRWVARLVDYERQRRSYRFLIDAHDAMEQETVEREGEWEASDAERRTIEEEVSQRRGLTNVLREGQDLYQRRSALGLEIQVADERHERLLAERERLEGTRGEFYVQALEEYVRFLKAEDVSRLFELARSTETRSDDGLVARIDELDKHLEHQRSQRDTLAKERGAIAEKLTGLYRLENEFRGKDYDASNSRFGRSFDIDDLLTGYWIGRHTLEHVSKSIRKTQSFQRRKRSRSSGFGSSGFGGGGFSSGGGFSGGGGFSTGGGF